MLRITAGTVDSKELALRLEGQLIGPWVDELSRVCQPSSNGRKELTIDLAEVSFADRSGVALLKDLRRHGARLVNGTVFIREQLDGS